MDFVLIYNSECSSGSRVENKLLNFLDCHSFLIVMAVSLRNVYPISDTESTQTRLLSHFVCIPFH